MITDFWKEWRMRCCEFGFVLMIDQRILKANIQPWQFSNENLTETNFWHAGLSGVEGRNEK